MYLQAVFPHQLKVGGIVEEPTVEEQIAGGEVQDDDAGDRGGIFGKFA